MLITMSNPNSQDPSRNPTPSDKQLAAMEPLRVQIDQLDRKIVQLLNDRAKIVVKIGKIKRDGDGPIYAPDRERAVLEQVRSFNEGPLPESCLESIWRELMSGSFALERPLRVGYLGPPGSFSHLAARKKFGASVQYHNLDDIPAVFEQIARGHLDYGLVPIENSAIGGISDTLDSFMNSSVRVCAELLINVHHYLLSNPDVSGPEQICRVYSKPEALGQCRKWLSMQLRHAERIKVASTSKAAELAAKEPGTAAIASLLAAEIYNLKVQFENIEDNPHNTTRFFIIGKQGSNPTDDDKTSLMFTAEHKPGALVNVLDVFREHRINLTHIDKRPSQQVNWEYIFFVDLIGHFSQEKVAAAIEDARKHCLQLTVLGSFPRATEVL